jgi:hypothetical protein
MSLHRDSGLARYRGGRRPLVSQRGVGGLLVSRPVAPAQILSMDLANFVEGTSNSLRTSHVIVVVNTTYSTSSNAISKALIGKISPVERCGDCLLALIVAFSHGGGQIRNTEPPLPPAPRPAAKEGGCVLLGKLIGSVLLQHRKFFHYAPPAKGVGLIMPNLRAELLYGPGRLSRPPPLSIPSLTPDISDALEQSALFELLEYLHTYSWSLTQLICVRCCRDATIEEQQCRLFYFLVLRRLRSLERSARRYLKFRGRFADGHRYNNLLRFHRRCLSKQHNLPWL